MKSIVLMILTLSNFQLFAAQKTAKSFTFQYKAPQFKSFMITRTANSKEEAFRLAAKDCFSKLTNNKYPGEEKGLEIIDICANPKI